MELGNKTADSLSVNVTQVLQFYLTYIFPYIYSNGLEFNRLHIGLDLPLTTFGGYKTYIYSYVKSVPKRCLKLYV